MARRVAFLNALRAFDAAAHHGNLTRAAEELSVSTGAISRHVALLEAHLGCQLFTRESRGVTLTQQGESYFNAISQALNQIDLATKRIRESANDKVLNVSSYTTFSVEWLIPRLPNFYKSHPEVEIALRASTDPPLPNDVSIDVGIKRGDGALTEFRRDALYHQEFVPVCTPDFLERNNISVPADISDRHLLYAYVHAKRWNSWLRVANVNQLDVDRGLRFESSSLSYRAAREGVGMALAQRLYIVNDIKNGNLVAPFPLAIRTEEPQNLICLAKRQNEPSIKAFREWVIEEIRLAHLAVSKYLPCEQVVTIAMSR